MANTSNMQWSFAGGVWSESSHGRVDRPDYVTAMNANFNGVSLDEGAWVRRNGTRVSGYTFQGRPAKQLRFGLSGRGPLLAEVSDIALRMWDGPTLVKTKDARVVSSFTGAPVVVVLDDDHAWATGDEVEFVGSPQLVRRTFIITVTDTDEFTAVDAVTGVALNAADVLTAPTDVQRVLRITTPYAAGTWADLQIVQAEQDAVLLNGTKPQVLAATEDPADPTGLPLFEFSPLLLTDGPYLDLVGRNSRLATAGLQGIVTLVIDFELWEATKAYSIGDFSTYSGINYKSLTDQNVNNQPDVSPSDWVEADGAELFGPGGVQDTDVGRAIRLHSEPADWAVGTAYVIGDRVKFAGTYWAAIASTTGDEPGADVTNWIPSVSGAHRWTWGRIVGLGALVDNLEVGAVNIGDYTGDAGLAAIFDGVLSQAVAASGTASITHAVLTRFQTGAVSRKYFGRNLVGATPSSVKQVTIYPPNDAGFIRSTLSGVYRARNNTPPFTGYLTFTLYGKTGAAPASSTDGTVLGSVSYTKDWPTDVLTNQFPSNVEIDFGFPSSPISIASSDTTTVFDHVWIEAAINYRVNDVRSDPTAFCTFTSRLAVAEMRIFSAASGSGGGIDVEILGKPLLSTAPIREWRLGVYADSTSWPRTGTYHEGRLWLAGAVKNRFDTSKSNNIFDMAPTEEDGTVTAASGISYIFNSTEVNDIYWMAPDARGVVCGTKAGEWLVQAGSAGAIAANNIKASIVTRAKCANQLPVRTEHTLVFTQLAGVSVREQFSDVNAGVFSTTNLSERADDLTLLGIEQLKYTASPVPVIWARRRDGTFLGCTYKRNVMSASRDPEVWGWHEHALGSSRIVTDIAVGAIDETEAESLAMVTRDETNLHVVEQMIPLKSVPWFLDHAAEPSGFLVVGNTVEFYGYEYLNDQTVTVYAGGLDCGDYVVADGKVVVPFGNGVTGGTGGGKFTEAFLTDDVLVIIGYSYTSRGQRLRPMAREDTGTQYGLFALGKTRRAHNYATMLKGSKGLSVGTDFDHLRTCQFSTPGGRRLGPLEFFSGIWRDTLDDDFSYDSMLCWQVSRPYPVTMMALGAFLRTQDS